jgi:YrbI family 3-deoxy-D-manno-octulosonate 8-phosphate phosphatase
VETRYTAFIPVRAGSKSIPLKNIKEMAGRPLVHWAIKAADEAPRISRIVVSTDSPVIERAALEYGSAKVGIHHRSAESATDTASTEQVMLEYTRENDDFDVMVLIQATSPLLTAADLEQGIDLFETGSYDSVLSAVRQARFVWKTGDGLAEPVNYDYGERPRRQEFDGFLVENGAFYLTSRAALLESGCRLCGRVGLVEMDSASYYEIDEPADWAIVEGLLAHRIAPQPARAEEPDLSKIKALFTDCDGVMTDGGMYYSESGDELKRFQTRDGVGLAMLKRAGLIVGIITSESVELVKRRGAKLGLDEVHVGVSDKLRLIDELCEKYLLSRDEVAYIGDDVMDIPVLEAVGFGCSVSDGMPQAKAAAAYVTRAGGGQGAVREVAELILACLRGE